MLQVSCATSYIPKISTKHVSFNRSIKYTFYGNSYFYFHLYITILQRTKDTQTTPRRIYPRNNTFNSTLAPHQNRIDISHIPLPFTKTLRTSRSYLARYSGAKRSLLYLPHPLLSSPFPPPDIIICSINFNLQKLTPPL